MKRLLAFVVLSLLLLPSVASAVDYKWARVAVEGTRWQDGGKVVGKAEANKRLEVLFTKGDKVRVRIEGGTFGWVDAASLSDRDPAQPAPPPAEAPAEAPAAD